MLRRAVKVPSYLAPLLRAGLITGIVVAAVAFPLFAIGGLGVLVGTDFIDRMPSQLRTTQASQVSYVYAADGKTLITQFYQEYRKYIPLAEISPNMLRAIVSSEDARFYEHGGVDPKGVMRAFVANQRDGAVSRKFNNTDWTGRNRVHPYQFRDFRFLLDSRRSAS